MKIRNIFLILCVLIIFVISCKDTDRNKKVNVKKIELPQKINIKRYEQALFHIDKNNLEREIVELQKDYRFFIGDEAIDSLALLQLKEYINDPVILKIYNDCNRNYPNLNDIEKGLNEAFKYYIHYFPETKRLPQVYTFISGINPQSPIFVLGDSLIIIGIDMFLGSNYYNSYGIPAYLSIKFSKDYLLPLIFYNIAVSKLVDCKSETFIDRSIYYGKILYFVDAMLPNHKDYLKMLYTREQLDWCLKNEKNIWAFMIDQKILFVKDKNTINRFIEDAPFTYHFGNKSPGRTGAWIGLQIVRSFMGNNKTYTLKQLLEEDNSQKILNLSKYKPS